MANYVNFWNGTQANYDAITSKNSNTIYFITDANKQRIYKGSILIADNTTPISVSAGNELTGGGALNGTSQIIDIAHREKLGSTYTSANSTTSIGGGETKAIKIPQLTVNEYGHIIAITDEDVSIAIPSLSGSLTPAEDTKVMGGFSVSGHAITGKQKNLTGGSNVTVTGGSDTISISAKDTTYAAGSGIEITGTDNKIGHKNNIPDGSFTFDPNEDENTILSWEDSFRIPTFSYDGEGHLTDQGEKIFTLMSVPDLVRNNPTTGNETLNHGDTISIVTDVAKGAGLSFTPTIISYKMPTMPTAADLGLSSALKFEGETLTAIEDGSTTSPITMKTGPHAGTSYTPNTGDVVIYDGTEYVWLTSEWSALGDPNSYALKTITVTGDGDLESGGSLENNVIISHKEVLGTSFTPTENVETLGIESNIVHIPLYAVNEYGHVTAAEDHEITIDFPLTDLYSDDSMKASEDATVVGGITAEGQTVSAEKKEILGDGIIGVAGSANTINLSLDGVVPFEHGGTGVGRKEEILPALGVNSSVAELNHSSGLTDNIQIQLNNRVTHNALDSRLTNYYTVPEVDALLKKPTFTASNVKLTGGAAAVDVNEQWSIKLGAFIEGKGNNLNDIWIG